MENKNEQQVSGCKNCGSFNIERGYKLELCASCRKKLAKRPISKGIYIICIPVIIVMVISLIKFPSALSLAVQMERGDIAVDNKKYVTAMNYYEELYKKYPDDFNINYKLMNAYYYNNYITDLYNTYDKLIGKEADEEIVIKTTKLLEEVNGYYSFSDGLYEKLSVLDNDASDEELLSVLEPYLEKNTSEFYGAYCLFNIYMDMERYDDARDIMYRIINSNMHFHYRYIMNSKMYTELYRYEDAINFANKMFSVNSESVDAYAALARVELKRKNNVEGLELAKKAYDLDNYNIDACINLALAYHYNNMTNERDNLYDFCLRQGYLNEKQEKFYSSIFLGNRTWQE